MALSLHPSSRYFATSTPSSFSLVDLHNLRVLCTSPLDPSPSNTSSPVALFQPAGNLLSVSGAQGLLVFDVLEPRTPQMVIPSSSPISSTAFSPSGVYCAVGSSSGSMRVFDLRLLRRSAGEEGQPNDFGAEEASVITVQPQIRAEGQQPSALTSLRFDDSGKHLWSAVGVDVYAYSTTSYEVIACWTEPAEVTRLAVGRKARWWASGNKDGALRFYRQPR